MTMFKTLTVAAPVPAAAGAAQAGYHTKKGRANGDAGGPPATPARP